MPASFGQIRADIETGIAFNTEETDHLADARLACEEALDVTGSALQTQDDFRASCQATTRAVGAAHEATARAHGSFEATAAVISEIVARLETARAAGGAQDQHINGMAAVPSRLREQSAMTKHHITQAGLKADFAAGMYSQAVGDTREPTVGARQHLASLQQADQGNHDILHMAADGLEALTAHYREIGDDQAAERQELLAEAEDIRQAFTALMGRLGELAVTLNDSHERHGHLLTDSNAYKIAAQRIATITRGRQDTVDDLTAGAVQVIATARQVADTF